MKRVFLSIVLLLSGCINGYQPKLAEQPEDQARYEADRRHCVSESKDRKIAAEYSGEGLTNTLTTASFGLVGSAFVIATDKPKDDDLHKKQTDMIDECMAKLGYKVIIPNN